MPAKVPTMTTTARTPNVRISAGFSERFRKPNHLERLALALVLVAPHSFASGRWPQEGLLSRLAPGGRSVAAPLAG
jgi:hypothetical protein